MSEPEHPFIEDARGLLKGLPFVREANWTKVVTQAIGGAAVGVGCMLAGNIERGPEAWTMAALASPFFLFWSGCLALAFDQAGRPAEVAKRRILTLGFVAPSAFLVVGYVVVVLRRLYEAGLSQGLPAMAILSEFLDRPIQGQVTWLALIYALLGLPLVVLGLERIKERPGAPPGSRWKEYVFAALFCCLPLFPLIGVDLAGYLYDRQGRGGRGA